MVALASKIVNSVGLLFDIVGAWLVAWEVVKQYRGCQYKAQGFDDIGSDLEKEQKYEDWENDKFNKMRVGLLFLTLGFLCQIASNFL